MPEQPDAAVSPRTLYRRKWQEANRRRLGIEPVKIAPCGTIAAYRRHLRNGEPVDEFCNMAHNADAGHRRAVARLGRSQAQLAEATRLIEKLTKLSKRRNGKNVTEALTAARSTAKAARTAIAKARAAAIDARAEKELARVLAEKASEAA